MSRTNWTPHDLPFLRNKSVDILHKVATQWASPEWKSMVKNAPDQERAIRDFAETLDGAPLTWLDTDVCELIAGTMKSVPAWSPAATMPDESGIIAFEQSPLEAIWTGGTDGGWRTVNIDGLAWRLRGGKVTIRAISRLDRAREYLSSLRHGIPFDDVFGVTILLSGTYGTDVDVTSVRAPAYRGPFAQGDTLLSLVGATWLLTSQPSVTTEGPAEIRMIKRRDANTNKKVRQPVRVSIRKLNQPLPRKQRPGGKGTGRQATSRWWVRGHWRQQPWGKDRALRKPIFIAPHLAGAQEADIDNRPHVQVIRND